MLESISIGEHYIPLGEYTIGAVHTLDDLAALKPEWDQLLVKSAHPTIYLSWDWIAAWWKIHKEPDHELWILCARQKDDGELVGIAPLLLMPQPRPMGSWRVLTFLGVWAAYHLNFIIQSGKEASIASAFMDYLNQRNREWDLIDLINMDSESSCLDGLFKKNTWYTRDSEFYAYMEFEDTWEDYWMAQSRNRRNSISRKERNLQKDYPDQEIAYRIHTDLSEVEYVWDKLFDYIYLRWADEGESKEHYFKSPFVRFSRAAAEVANRSGCLRLYSLWVGDELVAVEAYIFEKHIKELAHRYRLGCDLGKWQDYSIGTLLFNFVIRDMIESGVHRLELGEGFSAQKRRYASGKKEDLYIRSPARRDVQLWIQSMEFGRGVWRVIKQAMPEDARSTIRQALGYGEPGVVEQTNLEQPVRRISDSEDEVN